MLNKPSSNQPKGTMTKKTKAHPPVDNPDVTPLQAHPIAPPEVTPEVVAEAPLKDNQKVTISGSIRTDN